MFEISLQLYGVKVHILVLKVLFWMLF